jgi:MFS family permease
MGVGGAVSFVGPLILATRWFPAKYFAPISGLVQLLGAVGAVLGQVVLSHLVQQRGWRSAMMDAVFLGLILVVLVALIVRDYPKGTKVPPKEKLGQGEWHNLKAIFANKQTFILAFYSFFSWFPITVFAAFWGVTFLSSKFGVSTSHAAQMMAVVWLGVAVGSPLFGWWSEKIGQRNFPLSFAGLIGGIAAVFVIYFSLPVWLVLILLFVLGVGTSGQALSFAVVRDMNNNNVVGTAMGFNNVAVVAGGALGQPLVGYLVNLGWHGHIIKGVHVYSLSDYQQALVVIPLSFFMCFIFGKFLIEETHCKRIGEIND